ncbi:unnamed protein product [Caenorhabditis sp. 36 PRJEB53466]|nr:unnamed protein product [Caenorhabditis sp. 36 PRJEB53466]
MYKSCKIREFSPTLQCIPEEEPKIVAFRRITLPKSVDCSAVRIPIFDVNIYAPEPKKEPIPASYQRLLTEMDQYIEKQADKGKYREMAKSLRQQVALEQAENRRKSAQKFTDRDWYWYSEQTGSFSDEPLEKCEKSEENGLKISEKSVLETDENENAFDLSADF